MYQILGNQNVSKTYLYHNLNDAYLLVIAIPVVISTFVIPRLKNRYYTLYDISHLFQSHIYMYTTFYQSVIQNEQGIYYTIRSLFLVCIIIRLVLLVLVIIQLRLQLLDLFLEDVQFVLQLFLKEALIVGPEFGVKQILGQ